jgi:hypothetical protein
MIRKLLMVAAAAAVPMSAVAAAGAVGSGVAAAKAPVPVVSNASCALGGTVNFSTNPGIAGISLEGTATTNKTSTTTSSTSESGCTGGTLSSGSGTLDIVTKNTKCTAPYTSPPGCAKGKDIGEAGTGLASAGTTKSIEKAVKKLPITLVQGSNTFTLKSKVTSVTTYEDASSGPCANEVGFGIAGTFKTSPKSTGDTSIVLTVCLGQDSDVTGPSPSTDNFFSDLTAGDTIGIADIDPASSSIALS